MLGKLRERLGFHPRRLLHSMLTYRRFIGLIKPELLGARAREAQILLKSLQFSWHASELRAPIGKRLVVVAPHPDDESIGCGGLLLAHRGLSEVHILNLFSGDGGGRLLHAPFADEPAYREELVRARRAELTSAATALGVTSVRQLGLDGAIAELRPEHVQVLRAALDELAPDVVILPWFLDGQNDHRIANALYARAGAHLDCMVLGAEIWTLCQPNAVFDISAQLEEKARAVALYQTQNATIDYVGYVRALAKTRGFLQGVGDRRSGAAEGYFALPNRDYCEIVASIYRSDMRQDV